jgi:hypothetical protein
MYEQVPPVTPIERTQLKFQRELRECYTGPGFDPKAFESAVKAMNVTDLAVICQNQHIPVFAEIDEFLCNLDVEG